MAEILLILIVVIHDHGSAVCAEPLTIFLPEPAPASLPLVDPVPASMPLVDPLLASLPRLDPAPAVKDSSALGAESLPTVRGDEWWVPLVADPQRSGCQSMPLTLHQLAIETMIHSHEVEALRVAPQIQQTKVSQADAEFDVVAFVDSKWFDRDEPVGSVLATGGGPRLLEETFTENIGVRRKTRTGASVEIAQRLGYQESNSTFFVPNDQAQTRLGISMTQPLMRGRGRAFNESLIVLAQLDTRIAGDIFAEQLQDRLLRVGRQYWQLYLQRSLVLQQARNLQRARAILSELESREGIDAVRSQIERAKAKVATREAGWLRAQAGVRNAEATLRSLVNSPTLWADPCLELTPLDVPRGDYVVIPLPVARQIALAQRPEVDNLLTQIQSASVRLNVAHNQVMPSLALVLESYVNGLQGQSQLGKSLGDQFSKGAPSYSAGLVFELPIGNRRAKAQLRQRELELHRFYQKLAATMADLAAEVEIGHREVDIAYAELASRRTSLAATATEVDYLYQRWRRLPGHDQSASLFLEDLLDAEDRLVNEEQRVAAAQTTFAVAQVELKRAVGELVVHDPCNPCQTRAVPMPAQPRPAPAPANGAARNMAKPSPARF